MPVAQFAGAPRLGLRRRAALRPAPGLRHARRPARRSSTPPTARGLMVLLDVVYNHFGPDGNYLPRLRARLLPRRAAHALGRGDRLRAPAGAARSSSTTRSTGSTSSASTGCGSTPPTTSATPTPPRRSSSRSRGRCARAFPDRHVHLDHRGQPQHHPPARARPGRRAAALHRRVERRPAQRRPRRSPPARPRATTSTSPRTAGRSFARALAEGFAYQGEPSPLRGGAPRGVPSGAPAADSPSSTSCRTTTRSATAPSASG